MDNNRSISFAVSGFFVGSFISLLLSGFVEPNLPFGAGVLIAFGVGTFGWFIGKDSKSD